jgi:hydrogenase expression/formation protein HypE
MAEASTAALTCPIPLERYPVVTLAHGDGGRLTHQLVEGMFQRVFTSRELRRAHDGAVLETPWPRIAFTTDSFVVRPLFFPGGDIGRLAIHGTVNDLAMCGARPRHLSVGFILEEGFAMETLWRVVCSMGEAAAAARVEVVTGDTKVVERGKGDGVYVHTTGVGSLEHGVDVHPGAVQAGDIVLLSGDPGRHGVAVLAAREGLEFESEIESDVAPLAEPVLALLDAGIDVRCMRDVTRGGLATALVEIAETARLAIEISEEAIAVDPAVQGAADVLGLDPLYLASEGRFVAFVPAAQAAEAVAVLAGHEVSRGARAIGGVRAGPAGQVVLETVLGTSRVLDRLAGATLPRIC